MCVRQDFAEEGNGLTMALTQELKRIIELTGGVMADDSEALVAAKSPL